MLNHLKNLALAAALLAPITSAALAQEAKRPADIVSPITSGVQALKVKPDDAKREGRLAYEKPTPQNSIVLFIDHQIGLISGIRDVGSLAEYKSNVVGLAKITRALNIPVLLTSSNAQWQNGDLLPELKEVFPTQPIIRRTGIINAYEDPTFRKALEEIVARTGRRHIIIAGVTLGTCVAFPTLSLLNDGYKVYPVVDASGAWNRYEAEAAMARMSKAGADLHTVFALGAELQADWKLESGMAMLDPFVQNLPEYGLVQQGFWNNANKRTVSDPFGMVK